MTLTIEPLGPGTSACDVADRNLATQFELTSAMALGALNHWRPAVGAVARRASSGDTRIA